MDRWPEGGGVAVIPGILHLTRVNNTGAAFGLWKNSSLFLTVVSALSVVFIVCYLRRLLRESPAPASVYAWALVGGGALGNLYDRVRFGYVIDCIDLRVWPVFNVADSSLCLGVFLILLQFFTNKKTRSGNL
jgi:signal peptidase II